MLRRLPLSFTPYQSMGLLGIRSKFENVAEGHGRFQWSQTLSVSCRRGLPIQVILPSCRTLVFLFVCFFTLSSALLMA